MNLEGCYLFGVDIDLRKYDLGIIKQPKIVDYIKRDIDMESFYMPFLMNDLLIGKSRDRENVIELKNKLGSLTFFLTNCIYSKNQNFIEAFLQAVGFIFDTEKIEIIGLENGIQVGDFTINNSNFDILCDVVLEMLRVDKSSIKFDEDEENGLTDKMLEAKRKYLERTKKTNKEKVFTILDIANIVIHSDDICYDKVLNMTIYQLRNSFETLRIKDVSNVNLLHRISPKFETKKEDKLELWVEKIKINKSTLSR